MILNKYSEIDDAYYFKIFVWMHEILGLQGNTEKVYALIYECSNDKDNTCEMSTAVIAKICNCSEKSVTRALKELRDKGLIESKVVTNSYGYAYRKCWVTEKALNISKKKGND